MVGRAHILHWGVIAQVDIHAKGHRTSGFNVVPSIVPNLYLD